MRHRQKKYFCLYTLRIRVSVRENFAKIDDFFQFPPVFLAEISVPFVIQYFFLKKILRKHNLSILQDKNKHLDVSRNSLFSKYKLTKLKTRVEINPKIMKIWTVLSWPEKKFTLTMSNCR